MRARLFGSLTIGILLFPLAAAAQTPPRDTTSAEKPTGTARLSGRVVAADTGTAIRRAEVRASATTTRMTRLAATDGEGRYAFGDLPAGRYTIAVSKPGYVSLDFGQRRPYEEGRPIDLADGQHIDQIDFALPRGSVISGRISDDAGDPVVGAWVGALRYRYGTGGRRQLMPATSQHWLSHMTDDRGEFRLFGLMPGTYVISAFSTNTGVVSLTRATQESAGISAIETSHAPVQSFYPGTANIAEAAPVSVGLAEETQVAFSLVWTRMSKISGIVRRSDGQPPSNLRVYLQPADALGVGEGHGMAEIAPNGAFVFANVPPGDYMLDVGPRQAGASADRSSSQFASSKLSVSGSDIADLVVVTTPGITATGRTIFQGNVSRLAGDLRARVLVRPADPLSVSGIGLGEGAIDENGRFQISNIFGRVLFRLSPLPPGFVLRSVTLHGADITDMPYDSRNGNIAGLEVVVAEAARLVGMARNARGEPVKDYKVALFPANLPRSAMTTRFMHTATPDPNGRFQINQLPAGEFLGVAVESFELGEEWDPAFQKRVLPAARRFTVVQGQTLTVDLPFVE